MRAVTSLLAVFVLSVIASREANTKKVFHIPPEVSEKIVAEFLKCSSKLGLDSTIVNMLKEGKYTEDDRIIEAMVCLNHNLGFGTADGRINVDKVMNDLFLNNPEIRSAMEACEKDYGKNPVETFKTFMICYREKSSVNIRL